MLRVRIDWVRSSSFAENVGQKCWSASGKAEATVVRSWAPTQVAAATCKSVWSLPVIVERRSTLPRASGAVTRRNVLAEETVAFRSGVRQSS